MPSVAEYLNKNATPTQRAEFERIYGIVKQVAPGTETAISYGIIGFKYKGKYLVYFGAFKDHMGLYGGLITTFEHKLKDYKLSHKGTVQFTEDHPLPDDVLREIIRRRAEEIESKL